MCEWLHCVPMGMLAVLRAILSHKSFSNRRFSLYEPIEFIKTHLKDKLEWSQVRDNVAIHVPCSSKKMGVTEAFAEVAGLCSKEVTPSNIPCCGMHPPLPSSDTPWLI